MYQQLIVFCDVTAWPDYKLPVFRHECVHDLQDGCFATSYWSGNDEPFVEVDIIGLGYAFILQEIGD